MVTGCDPQHFRHGHRRPVQWPDRRVGDSHFPLDIIIDFAVIRLNAEWWPRHVLWQLAGVEPINFGRIGDVEARRRRCVSIGPDGKIVAAGTVFSLTTASTSSASPG